MAESDAHSSTPSAQMPPEWAARGLVVVAGAAVSTAAPARVPSWGELNEAVLAGLRRQLVSSSDVPIRARRALRRLSLAALDVTEFSQVVHDTATGVTWSALLRALDGGAPNVTHRTIASLAQDGVVRAVITTNLDTLFERTLPASFARVDAVLDDVPRTPGGVLVKLHGTVGLADSLVDVAAQKRRGIGSAWWTWLREIFAQHCVLVLGFPGAELELGEDYLGLRAASHATPWLGWNVGPGSTLHPKAAEILAASGERGRLVSGDLPGVMADLGVRPVSVASASGRAPERVAAAVDAWLAQPQIDGDVCRVVLARLLDAAGSRSAARALLRTSTTRDLRQGIDHERAGSAVGRESPPDPCEESSPDPCDADARRRRRYGLTTEAVILHCPGPLRAAGSPIEPEWRQAQQRVFADHATKGAFSDDPGLTLITYNTRPEQSLLERCAQHLGVGVTVLGRGLDDWKWEYKVTLVLDHLRSQDVDGCVICLDAADTLLLASPETVLARFRATGAGVLFCSTSADWPPSDVHRRFELGVATDASPAHRFLNANYIGAVPDVIACLDEIVDGLRTDADWCRTEAGFDDQLAWRELHRRHHPNLQVDKHCTIFARFDEDR